MQYLLSWRWCANVRSRAEQNYQYVVSLQLFVLQSLFCYVFDFCLRFWNHFSDTWYLAGKGGLCLSVFFHLILIGLHLPSSPGCLLPALSLNLSFCYYKSLLWYGGVGVGCNDKSLNFFLEIHRLGDRYHGISRIRCVAFTSLWRISTSDMYGFLLISLQAKEPWIPWARV